MSLDVNISPELLWRLQRDEEVAFRRIYDQLYPFVYRFVNGWVKDDAVSEELVQETFVSLWLRRHKFDTTSHLTAFVYLVARRMAIDHFRKKLSESRAKELWGQMVTAESNVTEDSVIYDDLERFAERTIESLPTQQQAVFKLNRGEGLTYDEIASRLRISPNTVRNHMVSALKTLKLHFNKHNIFFSIFISLIFNRL